MLQRAKPRMSGIAVILLISGKHVQAERKSFNIYHLSCFVLIYPCRAHNAENGKRGNKKVWRQLRTVYFETEEINGHEAV